MATLSSILGGSFVGNSGPTGATGSTGSTGPAGPIGPRSISITYPGSAENTVVFYTTSALTLTDVRSVISGGSSSVTFSIVSGASRASPSTTHVNAQLANSTTTGTSNTISNASIPANTFVVLTTSAISGTPLELNVTLTFA